MSGSENRYRSGTEFIPHVLWLQGDPSTECCCNYCLGKVTGSSLRTRAVKSRGGEVPLLEGQQNLTRKIRIPKHEHWTCIEGDDLLCVNIVTTYTYTDVVTFFQMKLTSWTDLTTSLKWKRESSRLLTTSSAWKLAMRNRSRRHGQTPL